MHSDYYYNLNSLIQVRLTVLIVSNKKNLKNFTPGNYEKILILIFSTASRSYIN